jgi:WhiB family redox-sensing transcriptional regulator
MTMMDSEAHDRAPWLSRRNVTMIKILRGRGITSDGGQAPWRERAACREAGVDLFFPIGSTGLAADEARQARQICAGCPVRQECLDYALASGQQYGIWGGRDEQERRLLRQQRREPRAGPADARHASGRAGARTGRGPC